MKKTLVLFISALMIALTCITAFAADYSCTLVTSGTSVKEGDTVSVDVRISDGLSGVVTLIKYDSDKFQFISGEECQTMYMMTNTETAGEIRIAAVSDKVQASTVIYSFKLKVISCGGKIVNTVSEALDSGDSNIASEVETSTLSFSSHGLINSKIDPPAEPASQAVTNGTEPNSQPDAVTEGEGVSQGESVTDEAVSAKVGTPEANVGTTDENGNTVKPSAEDEQSQKQSKTGLIIAIILMVASLSAGVSVILFARSSRRTKKSDSVDEK